MASAVLQLGRWTLTQQPPTLVVVHTVPPHTDPLTAALPLPLGAKKLAGQMEEETIT